MRMIENDTPSGREPNRRITEVIKPQPMPKMMRPLRVSGEVV